MYTVLYELKNFKYCFAISVSMTFVSNVNLKHAQHTIITLLLAVTIPHNKPILNVAISDQNTIKSTVTNPFKMRH